MRVTEIPKDGLPGLKENWRADAISGFLVFLLALPLSLGIAKASEFPPAMGVLTAMVGGLVVGIFQGGRLTIKGPAAGLITVCSGAVLELGGGAEGWHLACGVIVVTAAIQIVLGLLKFGSLSDFFPHSAVHGMLAAIGVIILAKQVPVLLGVDPSLARGLSPIELYTHIPTFVANASGPMALVGIVSLIILFGLPALKIGLFKKIPAPMIVLVISIPLAIFLDFKTAQPGYALVKIGNFWESVGFNAEFSAIGSFTFWKYVFMFLFVNSLESLLTVKAIDDLDPFRRKSNFNQDLTALGAGNSVAGLLGGLPMISEVVRSAANVNFGGRTRWSNVFHGLFLFLAMLLVIPVIEMIPNASLAAMLIFAGYRLAAPKQFIGAYKIGPEQLVIFLVTIFVTVAEDLLLGVACGILVKLIFHVINGAPLKSLFKARYDIIQNGDRYLVKVLDAAIFSNFLGYKKLWGRFDAGQTVVFDFSNARLVDHSFMEHLHRFEEDYHHNGGGKVAWMGLDKFNLFSDHPLAARKASAGSANKIEFKLNQRQAELRVFAEEYNFTFYPQKIRNAIKYRTCPLLQGHKFQYEENVLSSYSEIGKLEISDILLTEGANTSDTAITLVTVTETNFGIPDFALEPEGIWTKLSEFTVGKDIDFHEHADFSNKYYLRGTDERAVRAFFNADVIGFFENHHEMCMESSRNKLIVYKKRELLTMDEIAEVLSFVEEFIRVVEMSSGVLQVR